MTISAAKASPIESLESQQLLSGSDVCKFLKVSRTTLYGLISRKVNPIPSVRIGKSRRFPLDGMLEWKKKLVQ